MNDKLYRIRPLVWQGNAAFSFAAPIPFRRLTASLEEPKTWWAKNGGQFVGKFPSLESAQAAAEAHWQETIKQALEPVEEKE